MVPVGDIISKFNIAKSMVVDQSKLGMGVIVKNFMDKDPTAVEQLLTLRPHNIWISRCKKLIPL